MANTNILHFTDIHERADKLAVITQYVANSDIDAVTFTGDIYEFNPRSEGMGREAKELYVRYVDNDAEVKNVLNEFRQFLSNHNIQKDEDLEKLSEEEKKQFLVLVENKKAVIVNIISTKKDEMLGHLDDIISESTISMVNGFKALSEHTPVYGTLGNHDLTILYDQLSSYMTFVDKQNSATIKGKDGLELIVKGDLNTWEVPVTWSQLPGFQELVGDKTVDYVSGHNLVDIDQELSSVNFFGDDEKKEKANTFRNKVVAYQQKERERLGNVDDPIDIYLTHKLPSCKTVRPDIQGYASSDVTIEYASKARLVCGGHFHDGQFGNINLTQLVQYFKSDQAAKMEIEGEEVSLLELEDTLSTNEFNPGTEHFFVYSYDNNKEIEHIDVYEYTYN